MSRKKRENHRRFSLHFRSNHELIIFVKNDSMRLAYLLILCLFVFSCASIPKGNYAIPTDLSAPNYNDLSSWAAHPDKQDEADKTPSSTLKNNQAAAEIDVFFLHPTSYTKSKER